MRDKKDIISDFLKLSPEDKVIVVNGLSAVQWDLGGGKYGSITDMVGGGNSKDPAAGAATQEEIDDILKVMGY